MRSFLSSLLIFLLLIVHAGAQSKIMRRPLYPSNSCTYNDVSGLILWLEAGSGAGSSDGDAVGTWTDQSASANNATNGTAGEKPTYKVNIVNGLPVVRFDGGDKLNLAANINQSTQTIFVVANKTADASRYFTLINTDQVWMIARLTGGDTWGVIVTTEVDSGVQVTSTFTLYSVVARAANDLDLVTNASLSNFVIGVAYNGIGSSQIGDFSNSGSTHQGDIALILVYNSALSLGNQAAVRNCINTKYALF